MKEKKKRKQDKKKGKEDNVGGSSPLYGSNPDTIFWGSQKFKYSDECLPKIPWVPCGEASLLLQCSIPHERLRTSLMLRCSQVLWVIPVDSIITLHSVHFFSLSIKEENVSLWVKVYRLRFGSVVSSEERLETLESILTRFFADL
jgi:hypothetical protein